MMATESSALCIQKEHSVYWDILPALTFIPTTFFSLFGVYVAQAIFELVILQVFEMLGKISFLIYLLLLYKVEWISPSS